MDLIPDEIIELLVDSICPATHGPGNYSAPNRSEYQKMFFFFTAKVGKRDIFKPKIL
jgi:hypothetical protein